ncbi:MAG: 2-dehydropantoate 2-reductase N-terminal domain-containing protein, partial [Candidatus Latescibacteria bacterium]|nr:2-dehydropantoate 2-reductase N-terminal domain-containing protein [Candidatus Latescibacterota bacterium]
MRYIIYGAGGIGCTIGGHLFRTGHEVALVGNAEHMSAIEDKGLTFATGDGVHTLKIPAFKTAEELAP